MFKRGFSLVELAVVILIIGLIGGMVVGGTNALKNAKLRNVVSELTKHNNAVNNFKEKFRYYPGDFPNATNYWSGTANGNGNWQIIGADPDFYTTEPLRAWQHLYLSNMLSSFYSGVDEGTPDFAISKNVPHTALENSHLFIYYFSDHFNRTGNAIQLGSNNSDSSPIGAAYIDAADARDIDNKLDDGIANTGELYGIDGTGESEGDCSDKASDDGNDYVLSKTTKACRLLLWLEPK